MPRQGGIETLPALLPRAPGRKGADPLDAGRPALTSAQAFAAGASGYVLKEAADNELVDAIREVARGGRYVHPELGARLIEAEVAADRKAEQDPLSDREREVLRLLALGHTNQEIAAGSSSRSARPRRTAPTSCRSSGSPPGRSWCYALVNGLLESG